MAKPRTTGAPRDFTDFLIEFSVALHRHAMYPHGHPSLGPAAESVTRHAERLFGARDLIAFGIARHQLIIDGVLTDARQPVLRRLAESLHRHHLGAVSLLRGIQPPELAIALRALAVEPDRAGAVPIPRSGRLDGCDHIRLHPLNFDGLTLEAEGLRHEGAAAAGDTRSAELWMGLARAAMAGERTEDEASLAGSEPDEVAGAIDRHQGQEAYDQVVVGYLLQIVGELKHATGAEVEALRRKSARLISTLRPATLRRLVDMGGNASQRNAFVLDASHGMAVEAVLDIVKAAADANGQTISHGLVRMLTKLSAHAEMGKEPAKLLADAALREQVRSLISDWQLDDPNPDEYRQMLQYLSTASPAAAGETAADTDAQTVRLVQMSLEIGTPGPLADRAIDACLADGGLQRLLALLAHPPPGSGPAAHRLRARLTQPGSLATLASREPLDEAALDALLPFVPLEGYAGLLDVLASSRNRTTRRRLLDRLSRAPFDISSLVANRIEHEDRWYVRRNLLLLLGRLPGLPSGFSALRWTSDADARVRIEAVRFQLDRSDERDLAIRAALNDADARIVRLGLSALQPECPSKLTPLVIAVVHAPRVPDDLRVLAVQVLGTSRHASALEALLPLVAGGRNMLGRQRLAPKSAVVVAALCGLASGWPTESRAAAYLKIAGSSPDEDLRRAAAVGE